MFLADAGIALWILTLLLVGLVGFAVMVVALFFRFLGWAFRTIIGAGSRDSRKDKPQSPPTRRVICQHPDCGHENEPTALYCARCGRPLRRTYDVDAYG